MFRKILMLVALLIVAAVVFLEKTQIKNILQPQTLPVAASPSAQASPQVSPMTEKIFNIIIKNKKLSEGPETIIVMEGDTVTLRVTSDIADELHLHGYDKSIDLEKGKEATLTFVASLTGRFVYELEDSKAEIGAIEVQPK